MSFLVGGAFAGDLTPPAGPVASTMKTLSEVEPRIPVGPLTTPGDAESVYRITTGGSYYLTADVVGEAGKHGIAIASSDVTLDLTGYSLRGVVDALDGIHVGPGVFGLRIVGGRVFFWPGDGVDALSAQRSQFIDLYTTNNGERGLATGPWAHVTGITSDSNDAEGIVTGNRSTVSSSIAIRNGLTNIVVAEGAIVRDCIASQSMGGDGIEAAFLSVIESCVADNNAVSGIRAIDRNTVRDCQTSYNGEHGVHTTFAGLVDSAYALSNGTTGIYMDAGGATTILNSTAGGSPVGIRVSAGNGSRVEGNTVIGNTQIGILVQTGGNIIVGNYVGSSPTTYSVAGGNLSGPIVTAANVATNDNPHANYEY